MKIPIEPNFRTDPKDYSEEERAKLKTKGLTEDTIGIYSSFHDLSREDLEKEVSLIAKSFGIYIEFNRDKMKLNGVKDWIYMVRLPIPGGGPISSKQWRILDDISNKYTISDAYTGYPSPSLKLTTRQAIQFHHVKKRDLPNLIREVAESGFLTVNGCGDNVRNTIACPLSKYWVFDANSLARKIANYFRLPLDLYLQVFEIPLIENRQFDRESFKYGENLLPRKFKIAIAGVLRTINGKYIIDNCVEVQSNDIGIVPLIEDEKVIGYQIYVGGSMGENNSYPTFSALGLPIGTVVNDSELIKVLDAIVTIQEEWGDRKNRHWARFKYVVYKMGLEWLREKVREHSGIQLGKIVKVDLTHKDLHLGWINLGDNKWAYGIFVENGRLIDGKNGRTKSMIRYIADNFDNLMFYITPNQHLLITEIDQPQKEKIDGILREFNYGFRDGKPYSSLRINSTACVGFPTCKLSFTDSERFLPSLIDELERRGWKDIPVSIGLSGCVAQCSRPALHPISWVGSGYELYMLKIGGGNGSLGEPLIDWDENSIYLYQVPSNRLADVTEALFELYEKNKDISEDPSLVFRLLGNKKIIEWLKGHEKTKDLMKPHKFDRKIEGYREYHDLLRKRLEEVSRYG
ncbi:nitrite/sulfite reductase [Saccharolobus solfataricus]|uniref:Sulfite reductase hemoprotein beta component (CysI) n=3 Tax=Saccharolobus solfataricus TaxID=2287 RepID=Q97UT4_SACS2|nr:nitrite/sulfite reductase [Saccharolobus solfataricus]AAK43018.1 Sulfite reductase hemoprotein beta component (cysI) [Saccharolobus solfataricus P2]AKA73081.1 nitrite/sulfite reductase [Saccharolobus solfataricus]AKA75779.1 nitrite/sulfite reductase [Saccharolobus solfataricus]AKA78471.1 nitrite/sulfite reductase [Saccharolobus solfataricus]AZF67587.1 nitrite/sulfite reductase [Saccharolobus solfataricus]